MFKCTLELRHKINMLIPFSGLKLNRADYETLYHLPKRNVKKSAVSEFGGLMKMTNWSRLILALLPMIKKI